MTRHTGIMERYVGIIRPKVTIDNLTSSMVLSQTNMCNRIYRGNPECEEALISAAKVAILKKAEGAEEYLRPLESSIYAYALTKSCPEYQKRLTEEIMSPEVMQNVHPVIIAAMRLLTKTPQSMSDNQRVDAYALLHHILQIKPAYRKLGQVEMLDVSDHPSIIPKLLAYHSIRVQDLSLPLSLELEEAKKMKLPINPDDYRDHQWLNTRVTPDISGQYYYRYPPETRPVIPEQLLRHLECLELDPETIDWRLGWLELDGVRYPMAEALQMLSES